MSDKIKCAICEKEYSWINLKYIKNDKYVCRSCAKKIIVEYS